MLFKSTLAAAALSLLALPVLAQDTEANPDASLYFIGIEDGDTVSSPLTLRFGLSGMGVAPAGTEKEMTGHHHLLIDRPPLGEGEMGEDELTSSLPSDDNHRHFGGGQTETSIELEPGEHTLQLVLGNMNHVPHNPPVTSDQITVTVE
ncbi:DUF4399 domain-containing protein [Thalassococcus sp. BH17M4-6]|uniref:DUF4399 domain-containing protein n=1 Tax=Thalassococcus sp. BH17M4-6 TaxID=3413148 RepID=UPI003BC2919F